MANELLRPLDAFINRLGPSAGTIASPPAVGPAPAGPVFRVHVAVPSDAGQADAVVRVLAKLLGHRPRDVTVEPAAQPTGPLWVRAEVSVSAPQLAELLGALQALPGVGQVRGEVLPAVASELEVD